MQQLASRPKHRAPARGKKAREIAPGLTDRFQRVTGTNVGDVRIHQDASANSLARRAGGDAATMGKDIYLSRSVSPQRNAWLIAHELAHTNQPGSRSVLRAGKAKKSDECPSRDNGERKKWDSRPFYIKSMDSSNYYSRMADKCTDGILSPAYKSSPEYQNEKPKAWLLFNFPIGSGEIDQGRLSGEVRNTLESIKQRTRMSWSPSRRCNYKRLLVVRGNSDCHGMEDVNMKLNAGRRNVVVRQLLTHEATSDEDQISTFKSSVKQYPRMPTDDMTAQQRAMNRSVWIFETLDYLSPEELNKQEVDKQHEQAEQNERNRTYQAERRRDEWRLKLENKFGKNTQANTISCLFSFLWKGANDVFEAKAAGRSYESILRSYPYLFLVADKMWELQQKGVVNTVDLNQQADSALDRFITALSDAPDYDTFETNYRRIENAVENSVGRLRKIKEAWYLDKKNSNNMTLWMHNRMEDPKHIYNCIIHDLD